LGGASGLNGGPDQEDADEAAAGEAAEAGGRGRAATKLTKRLNAFLAGNG